MELLKGLYHADKLDEQTFIDNFTIRLKEFKEIIDNLKQQKQKPLQHFLITGKRGMGKSTLLRRIYLEACTPPLSDKLFAVRLGAEQYRLSRLFKLWELVIEHLGNNEPKLLEQKAKLNDSKDYEDNLIHIITDYLTETKKTLLLLIDNFDQFLDKLTAKEKHQLREILIEYPVQIIGNTVFYNEHFKSYNEPFFDFFKPVKLENLDKEEADDFIKLRAENEGLENFDEVFKNQYGKIQTLRILSGGVPRTLLILLSIISKKNTGDAVDYLHEMLEQVTPLYQDRMKFLSPQQQEIMHHLAMHWDRTPVKELAAEMRIPSKSISAQLLALESMGYINKIETTGRNNFYEIDERFFNIWLLMSEAPPYDSKRVIWLTKWLDAFYSNDELKDYASFCHNSLLMAKPANRFLIAQALSESEKLDDGYKINLVKETKESLKDILSDVTKWANAKSESLYSEIEKLIKKTKYKLALAKADILLEIDPERANFAKGKIFLLIGDMDNAEKYFKMLPTTEESDILLLLGLMLEIEKNDSINSEKYFLLAADKGNSEAMFNLGHIMWFTKKDIPEAEKYLRAAANKGNVNAMSLLGRLLLTERKDIDSAERYLRTAVENNNIEAALYLGILLFSEKKDVNGAEKYFTLASNNGNTDAMVTYASFLCFTKEDFINAEKYYIMAMEKGSHDAMFYLSNLYFETNTATKKTKALELCTKFYHLKNDKDPIFISIYISALLWNEKVNEAKEIMLEFLNGPLHLDENMNYISNIFECFIVFRQKQFLYKTFTTNQELIDRYKPVYYALMHEMQNEYPNEYLKMPEELQEPVNKLLDSIKKEQKRLGL